MNEPAARRSSDVEGQPTAVHCPVHDLYHNTREGCWKCAELDASGFLRPVVDRQEAPRRQEERRGQRYPNEVGTIWDGFRDTAQLNSPAAPEILAVCLDLAAFLMEKNAAYGNSALEPVRVVSKADAAEQIRVRIDDKLSRLFRGNAGGEDALKDLVGYWVLLRVAEKRAEG